MLSTSSAGLAAGQFHDIIGMTNFDTEEVGVALHVATNTRELDAELIVLVLCRAINLANEVIGKSSKFLSVKKHCGHSVLASCRSINSRLYQVSSTFFFNTPEK